MDVKDKTIDNRERRVELEQELTLTDELPVLLHPKMADHYKKQIDRLVETLNKNAFKHEAQDTLRSLIDKIVLRPNDNRDGLIIDLHGDLAGILAIAETKAEKRRKSVRTGTDSNPVLLMVGPEGLEPPT